MMLLMVTAYTTRLLVDVECVLYVRITNVAPLSVAACRQMLSWALAVGANLGTEKSTAVS